MAITLKYDANPTAVALAARSAGLEEQKRRQREAMMPLIQQDRKARLDAQTQEREFQYQNVRDWQQNEYLAERDWRQAEFQMGRDLQQEQFQTDRDYQQHQFQTDRDYQQHQFQTDRDSTLHGYQTDRDKWLDDRQRDRDRFLGDQSLQSRRRLQFDNDVAKGIRAYTPEQETKINQWQSQIDRVREDTTLDDRQKAQAIAILRDRIDGVEPPKVRTPEVPMGRRVQGSIHWDGGEWGKGTPWTVDPKTGTPMVPRGYKPPEPTGIKPPDLKGYVEIYNFARKQLEAERKAEAAKTGEVPTEVTHEETTKYLSDRGITAPTTEPTTAPTPTTGQATPSSPTNGGENAATDAGPAQTANQPSATGSPGRSAGMRSPSGKHVWDGMQWVPATAPGSRDNGGTATGGEQSTPSPSEDSAYSEPRSPRVGRGSLDLRDQLHPVIRYDEGGDRGPHGRVVTVLQSDPPIYVYEDGYRERQKNSYVSPHKLLRSEGAYNDAYLRSMD